MTDERLLADALVIAKKLNDMDGIWFHYKAVKLLSFQTCYELCSHSLDMNHQGKVKTAPARYYNGCVMQEIANRGLKWNTKHND